MRKSDQCIIGPHLIDTKGNVRTFDDLVNIRITGTARHLAQPESKVYMLGMGASSSRPMSTRWKSPNSPS